MITTLREIIEANPEWADLPVVVLSSTGEYEYVGASAMVYLGEDLTDPELEQKSVVVFAPN